MLQLGTARVSRPSANSTLKAILLPKPKGDLRGPHAPGDYGCPEAKGEICRPARTARQEFSLSGATASSGESKKGTFPTRGPALLLGVYLDRDSLCPSTRRNHQTHHHYEVSYASHARLGKKERQWREMKYHLL